MDWGRNNQILVSYLSKSNIYAISLVPKNLILYC